MCGRYTRRAAAKVLADHFGIDEFSDVGLEPSFNVAPQTFQPVVRLNPDTDRREFALMRWGLVPFWAKDAKIGFSTINARAETLAASACFREAVKRRRCLVPADAFYEWKKLDAKTKQPYAIGMKDDSVFAFAGLWERWTDKSTKEPLETYTIITTEPNELAAGIHDRMPVILAPRDYDRWMAPADPARLPVDLLRPFDAGRMKAWKGSAAVGNVRNNSPELCIESLASE